MKKVISIMGLAAAGCGVLCLPLAEGVLVTMGLGGLAGFVCEWEKSLFAGFVAFTTIAALSAGAVVWRARSRANSSACTNCHKS